MSVRILTGDCRDVLASLPDASVQMVCTSPPYYGLREYGTATWEGGDLSCDHVVGELRTGLGLAKLGERYRGGGHKQAELGKVYAKGECPKCGALRIDKQIGLEPTPAEYVEQMVAVFREVRRVLRDDGTVWLNLGDSYNAYNGGAGPSSSEFEGRRDLARPKLATGHGLQVKSLKPKDLIGIPWRVAFALQADGWWLRSDIIWAKPNPMPESVTDRPTSAHEHVFLLAKAERYFFDAQAVRETSITNDPRRPYGSEGAWQMDGRPAETRPNGKPRTAGNKSHKYVTEYEASDTEEHRTKAGLMKVADVPWTTRNLRNVWTIATAPYAEAHFATFPPELAERCIKAGTSERGCCANCGAPWARVIERGELVPPASRPDAVQCQGNSETTQHIKGKAKACFSRESSTLGWQATCPCNAAITPCTVLDPFGGAGTTALVADRLGRNAILIELNPAYAAMAERRIHGDAPLFADVAAQ